MKLLRALCLLLVPFSLFLAGCGGGGGSGLAEQDVAKVGNRSITFAELDVLLAQAERSYKAQKREFPRAGSPEYQALQNQALATLVQRAQLAQKAEELKITISDKEIDDRLKQIKQQYFGGSDEKYRKELEKQGITDEQVRGDVRAQLISEALYNKVTADVKVGEADLRKHYDSNISQYSQAETRVVSHILVKDKATAERLLRQIRGGEDFGALAKQHSQDEGSKNQGGQLTITRGQTVPEFDKTAFELKTGQISQPVKTQFGWHIIRADKDATAKKVTPFKDVKEVIRQQLVSERKNQRLTEWYEGVKKEFESKTRYARGFGPIDSGTDTETQPTTTG